MFAKINLKYFLKEFLITNKTLDAHKGVSGDISPSGKFPKIGEPLAILSGKPRTHFQGF
jgi:hypothetical protein